MKPSNIILLICVVCSSIVMTIIKDGHRWSGDFSLYMHQAKCIAQDCSIEELYSWNKISMQNSIREIGPYLYPNGFPILLASVYHFFGMNFIAMKLFSSSFFILSIPLIFGIFKNKFENKLPSILLVLFLAFNFYYLSFSEYILSDFPYLFFCFLSLYLMNRPNKLTYQILLGLSIFYAYFTRDIGVFLLPTLVVFQLTHRKDYTNNRILPLLPYAVFTILFLLASYSYPYGGGNHLSMLFSNFSVELISTHLNYYLILISKLFLLDLESAALGTGISLLILIGALQKSSSKSYFITFLILNSLMLLLWPGVQGMRFMFPLIPFLFYYFIQGVNKVFLRLRLSSKHALVALSLYLVLFSTHSVINLIPWTKRTSLGVYSVEMQNIYKYVNQNISENIVGFKQPRVLHFFSETRSIFTDSENFDKSIAQYLLIEKDEASEILFQQWVIEKEFSNYLLFKKQ